MIDESPEQAGLAWQVGVWNKISGNYINVIDHRFFPVVEAAIARANLTAGESVLDLGTGTGAVAVQAAKIVGPGGQVIAVDPSSDMLELAQQRAAHLGLDNLIVREGPAESIPADDNSVDVVIASLSMMYVIDRETAAREIARVLRPGGRFVASVWAGAEECDIVLLQQTAGRFAGTPPVPGVGPGSMADPSEFLGQLEAAGIQAHVETQVLGFEFADFASAWDALAEVRSAHLSSDLKQEAKEAVMAAVYPDGDGLRHFRNTTQFFVGKTSA